MILLHCPACKGIALHHDQVDVYEREQDATRGIHARIRGVDNDRRQELARRTAEVTISTKLEGNPSERRQGIGIGFWCEECDCRSILTIAQHKGRTLVELVCAPALPRRSLVTRRRLHNGETALAAETDLSQLTRHQLQELRVILSTGALAMQSLDDLGPIDNDKAARDLTEIVRRLKLIDKELERTNERDP